MINRGTIEFKKPGRAIREAVTKFGGQPFWLEEPQWPLGAELEEQMRFICQIKLTNDLFPGCEGKMAYIFMTEGDEYVDGTWEFDGGENAVIIQPNGKPQVNVINKSEGPSLQKYVKKLFRKSLKPVDVELGVLLAKNQDPEFIQESTRSQMQTEDIERYSSSLEGNKIGGTPVFLQNDEFPDENSWNLLMQLDSCSVPFYVNFGDAGIGYAFINDDATIGKFVWQCG